MSTRLTFKPVTKATAKDFEALFEAPGGPKYCWCMAFRATPDEIKAAKGQARKPQMLSRIARRVPVGLIGYADGEPAAWVSIAPRETFRPLGGRRHGWREYLVADLHVRAAPAARRRLRPPVG